MSLKKPIVSKHPLVIATREVFDSIGFPFSLLRPASQDRTIKVFLALASLTAVHDLKTLRRNLRGKLPLLGTKQLMERLRNDWGDKISDGSYDDFRDYSIRVSVDAGILTANPDDPRRPTNSSTRVYGISSAARSLFAAYGTAAWPTSLAEFRAKHPPLTEIYRRGRSTGNRTMSSPVGMTVHLPGGRVLGLSTGAHNELQKAIIDGFIPRYVKEPLILYLGDTTRKQLFVEEQTLRELGVFKLEHQELPDVAVYDRENQWLFLIEAVASTGPMSHFRRHHLEQMLQACTVPIVYVSAFPDLKTFKKFATDISWESEVWVADEPDHLIHFNGEKFFGPYPTAGSNPKHARPT